MFDYCGNCGTEAYPDEEAYQRLLEEEETWSPAPYRLERVINTDDDPYWSVGTRG